MTRYEQEFYEDVRRIAKELEIANKLKILELSGENTSLLSVTGVKKEINGKQSDNIKLQ